jgi:aspartyl-tRNA(Asn)/glutamyl-tRNA(Gln) amidotransferase subunit A
VALDIVPFALGTDTGGSIRQPASFCGVVGMKPTYGAVSRYGVVAMASSTDVVGPLTHTVEDADTVMRVIAGRDEKDSTTLPNFYAPSEKKSIYRIGMVEEWMGDGVDAGVKTVVTKTAEALTAAGHTIETVKLPSIDHALAVYYVIVPAEVASNLARYDGVRYGVRSEKATDVASLYSNSREEGFMPENKRRIMIGNYVLSSGYYDAYFKKAARVRTLIIKDFETALQKYDFLIGPVAPTPAFKLGENTTDPLSMYLSDQMTVSASLAGLPAVSVPAGETEGLPVGLQIIGGTSQDSAVLEFAKLVEGLKS